jgi:hypothetical protein
MTNLLDTALDLARRGFHVLPLVARNKMPIFPGGYKLGTTDADQLRLWWTKNPEANIGIATGESNLLVMDNDHGLRDYDDFITWRDRNGLPPTYTVRSGRRPEFGVQMYYRGHVTTQGRKTWKLDGCTGDFKSDGGLVVHPPSIHPDSGEAYEVLLDLPIADRPDILLELPTADGEEKSGQANDEGLIECNRNDDMCSFIGKIRSQIDQLSEATCLEICCHRNDQYAKGPLPEDELTEILRKQYRLYPNVGPGPVVTIGSSQPKPATDWRSRYHTREDAVNAPPISFLIDGFLQREGVTAIAGPVRERKSLIALNVAHALVTGEKLFGHFEVVKMPERVLYLCPEVSLGPFTDRVKRIGLMDYVGENFFYRTLSAEGTVKLSELNEELPGSVVFLDTAIRFLEGKENDSSDVRKFADGIFALLRSGAESVVMLHHSPKEGRDVMTLENAMRGSGDLGAFLACCWGTRLQDQANPYQSASFLSNLKQRDFESKDFEVTCGPDCRLHIVGDPSVTVAKLKPRKGNTANRDGNDDAAEVFIRANLTLPIRKIQEQLAALGIERGTTWISKARSRVTGSGVISGPCDVRGTNAAL